MNIEIWSTDVILNFGIIVFLILFLMLLIMLIVSLANFFIKSKFLKYTPKISIIIPIYNEEKCIKECIESIFKSDYNLDWVEIICVNDGSTDNSASKLSKLKKKYPKIKIINTNHLGKASALNRGIKVARYEFILTIDADSYISTKFLKEVVSPFKNKNVGATNALPIIHKANNPIEIYQSVEYKLNNIVRLGFSKLFNNSIWFYGAAACYRKSVLRKVNMFDPDRLTEDMDILLKITAERYRVITVENADYLTEACPSISALINQRMRWFFGGLQSIFYHRALFKKSQFSIKFLFLSQYFWALYSILVIPLILYQINYWMPSDIEKIWYLIRWFSALGPFYVIYKIPEWGISFTNLFGVLSGVVSITNIVLSIIYSRKIRIKEIVIVFFYFPYTLLLNLSFIFSFIKYLKGNKRFR